MSYYEIGLILLFSIAELSAQEDMHPQIDSKLFNTYDVSKTQPLGLVNPQAPAATREFSFLIGKFPREDSLLVNGEWSHSQAIWQAHYILNGYGIQDSYRNDKYAGMSVRYYDSNREMWAVHFFGMPGMHTGLWWGKKEDDKMIMRQERKGANGQPSESVLTFFDNSDEGFRWQGQQVDLSTGKSTINWKIKATRIE